METVLELHFITENGKTARLAVNDPKEELDASEIQAAMEQIIQSNVFMTANGGFVEVKEARLVSRNVEVIEFN